jgi:acetone carboxylase gamma subunit
MTDEAMPGDVVETQLERLVSGTVTWDEAKELLHVWPKESDRFQKVIAILQKRVPWKDKILMRISDHVFIVRTDDGRRISKCECGHEFGDYRINWKFGCNIFVRKTENDLAKVYRGWQGQPDPDVIEVREFYCPQCATQLATENLPPGYPVLFEIMPDLDTFYREWLEEPLSDEDPSWYQDKTWELAAEWANEANTKR